ncbi:unnamed protein product [Brassica rapa]|uniref:Sodium/metabolite cotransporter BASS6, chloroplastic n=1 Tax=Brassica campestris TaxID=3711 RepID=A0A8D9GNP4_BRACM|nr:unnamed protein product [Brassica rapa]
MNVITTAKETLHLKSKLRLLPRASPAPYRSQRVQLLPLNPLSNSSLTSPARIVSLSQGGGSIDLWRRYASDKFSDMGLDPGAGSDKMFNERASSIVETLKKANSILPHVVLASTILALLYPPSFTWFTSRYFVPALGFLMFAVGINSNEKDFLEAFKRPKAILLGYLGQYLIKPLLGFIFGLAAVSLFQLPTPIGAGIMLVSCVSGAQLSNYATFLTDPALAPLSIVMTSLSTATAVLVTPMLSLLLIGKKLPVDVKGMVSSILQVVIAPIAAGLLLNKLFPKLSNAIRPFLPVLSVLDTACCVGAPLALNINSVVSPFGATILLLVTMFHLSAFLSGYFLTGSVFRNAPDSKALQRTLSYETGMQSSLLALALATKFFQDPLVGIPPAISELLAEILARVASSFVEDISHYLTVSRTISSALQDDHVIKRLNLRPQAMNPMLTFYRYQHLMVKAINSNNPAAHYTEGIKQFFAYDNKTVGLLHLKNQLKVPMTMVPISMASLFHAWETLKKEKLSYVPLGGRQADVALIVLGER